MKATKQEVNYGRGMRNSHCGKMDMADTGFCANFIERGRPEGACTEVQGTIGRGMWCERFKLAASDTPAPPAATMPMPMPMGDDQ